MDLAAEIERNVTLALAEDAGMGAGSGDLTAQLIPAENTIRATVISRESAVLCGMQWFEACFRQLGLRPATSLNAALTLLR